MANNDRFELRRGFTYFVKFVKEINYSKGKLYNFQISKKLNDGTYANIHCTWFPPEYAPKLVDGMKIKVLDIINASASISNGKQYLTHTISAEIDGDSQQSNFQQSQFQNQQNNFVNEPMFNSMNNANLNNDFAKMGTFPDVSEDSFSSFNIMEDDIQF